MPADAFEQIDEAVQTAGAEAAFDRLIERFRTEGNYAQQFEAMLMKRRHQLGLPLNALVPGSMPHDARAAYDETVVAAAREVGGLFLSKGEIGRAWPYYRAIGEPGPVRDAIEALPVCQADDQTIEVALNEQVHPRKGFEMLLGYHGVCRAITYFAQYPDPKSRGESLAMLVRTLHADLSANLKRAIEKVEGGVTETSSIPELLREWMFGPYDYFVDVSHLGSIVRHGAESNEAPVLRMALELTEYGRRLSPELQYKGDPPFEDLYTDYAYFLRSRLGEEVDACIAHFEAKLASYDFEQIGTYPAQIVVAMLVTLGRFRQAVETYERYCMEADPMYLNCPPLEQLCLMAGDFERLEQLAKKNQDPLRYLSAKLSNPEH
jgi:hypothetical protein